ncbi:unnamed protein product [Choristocarpus tenellus]
MKFTAAAVLGLSASAGAFTVTPCMKAESPMTKATTRADFVKFAAGAATALVAGTAPALAKAGTGPKQNLFGVIGSDMNLGGGASSYVPESNTYSAYSPYGSPSKAMYSKDDDFMVKVKIDILKDSAKKLETIPKFIEGKKWTEINSALTGKAYSLRDAMNYLSKGKPESVAAAKTFYKDIEAIILYAAKKNPDACLAAYTSAQDSLKKYLASI